MKKTSLRELSESLGVSPSTVFRALNGCGGVDPDTAARIRSFAQQQGYEIPSRGTAVDCVVILPYKPDYFWGEMRRNIVEELKSDNIRVMFYSGLDDTEGYLAALEVTVSLAPRLLITAVSEDPEIRSAIEASGIPVFFLCEYFELKNSFFFGSNPYEDGVLLANSFARRFPHCKRVLNLFFGRRTGICVTRTEAFFKNTSLQTVGEILFPDMLKPYAASSLARAISASEPFDCVYCETGILSSICLALDKCHYDPSIVVIGYEDAPVCQKYWKSGRLGMVVRQDIQAQAKSCTQAAHRYLKSQIFPDQKIISVPSWIRVKKEDT